MDFSDRLVADIAVSLPGATEVFRVHKIEPGTRGRPARRGAGGELLAAGANVDARDRHAQTALMRAAQGGQGDLVALPIEHGAAQDMDDRWPRSTPRRLPRADE